MEYSDIRLLLGLLSEARILVCVVGELALNYYNAPRVVHVCPPSIDGACTLTCTKSMTGSRALCACKRPPASGLDL